ncbi:MAG: Gfo/Idh/MocA family oxidoreductase [Candidatus Aenigmarchaeota archaeon]|nr:Gfo/Idh/MocA family oxidoreductase [Candidatus Aenigmarchaeota archaeon]
MANFVFIGCGKIANFHADVIYGMNHSISAVCARKDSPNIMGFTQKYKIKKTYDSWQEMLRKERPDAVIVAVSWDQTENIIEDVIKSGLPCLVEKPVALSSKKLQKIINNTKKFSKNVIVGYNRRFYEFIPKIREALKTKDLISIELNMPEAASFITKNHSSDVVDNMLVFMSSHWLDLLMHLIGDVKVVKIYRKHSKNDNTFRSYNGLLYSIVYNAPIHLQSNFNAPSQMSITFNFKDVIYKLCPIEMLSIYSGMDCIEPDDKVKLRRYVPRIKEAYQADALYKPGFYLQIKNFIETCVEHKKKNEIGCNLEDALRVTELCEKIKG